YTNRDLKIRFSADNIEVWDKGDHLYSRRDLTPDTHPDQAVAETLAGLKRTTAPADSLTVTCIGDGNGFSGRSASLLARFGRQALWIDPCAFPAHSLADAGVHWDDITHILITHNHEDHMSGISACLRRCAAQNRQLTLITAKNILRILKEQYQPLFPDIHRLIRFIELTPGVPLGVDGLTITSRLNHHILPYGTLGLKVSAGGKTVGISGDTKFCTTINRVINRPELEPEWFNACDLVLHEIDFSSAGGVHSYWEEVAKLRDQIPGTLYGYHSPRVDDPPIPLIRQGQTFRL
ncbi:MAG: MBL fold metallo-hydrolase, partial [Desulfobacterales bacterium]|nr:MBL fold metallo-hydrolase [Desulfobacterales bacterium]